MGVAGGGPISTLRGVEYSISPRRVDPWYGAVPLSAAVHKSVGDVAWMCLCGGFRVRETECETLSHMCVCNIAVMSDELER